MCEFRVRPGKQFLELLLYVREPVRQDRISRESSVSTEIDDAYLCEMHSDRTSLRRSTSLSVPSRF